VIATVFYFLSSASVHAYRLASSKLSRVQSV
jgi:hypothetical protein